MNLKQHSPEFKEQALRKLRDIPTEDLIGLCGHQGAWLAHLARHTLNASVPHLSARMQQAIHRGLAGYILIGIGQTGHDLTGRQVFKLSTIENPHDSIALSWAEFVGRGDLGA